MFKQARWMLLTAAVLLAGGLIGARPAAAMDNGLPQKHFGTVLSDHMDHRCCKASQVCDRGTSVKVNCCLYVACCEVGNRGFFTKTRCDVCPDRSGHPVYSGQGSCCCNSPRGETLRHLP